MSSEAKAMGRQAAFPIPNDPSPGAYPAEPGMSYRQWLAGLALEGLLAAEAENYSHNSKQALVENAVSYADLLIEALEKQP